MSGEMKKFDFDTINEEYGADMFKSILFQNGFQNDEVNILGNIIAEINNRYCDGDYHYIFDTESQDEEEYSDILFKYINILAIRTNLSYLRLFFDKDGNYNAIPVYQRIMRKKQTGNDSTNGSATVNLKNSNSPINAEPEVFYPTSKSSSSSSSNSSVTYNNVTDYDNINETEMRNYYANLETIVTWVRKHWFNYLIKEFQVNNA